MKELQTLQWATIVSVSVPVPLSEQKPMHGSFVRAQSAHSSARGHPLKHPMRQRPHAHSPKNLAWQIFHQHPVRSSLRRPQAKGTSLSTKTLHVAAAIIMDGNLILAAQRG